MTKLPATMKQYFSDEHGALILVCAIIFIIILIMVVFSVVFAHHLIPILKA